MCLLSSRVSKTRVGGSDISHQLLLYCEPGQLGVTAADGIGKLAFCSGVEGPRMNWPGVPDTNYEIVSLCFRHLLQACLFVYCFGGVLSLFQTVLDLRKSRE